MVATLGGPSTSGNATATTSGAPLSTAPPGPPGDENPFARAYADWHARTPTLCRWGAQGLVASYVVSWLVDLYRPLCAEPYKIVGKLQVYRLVTSPAVGNSLLGALVACVTLGDGVGPRLERSWGTVAFGIALLVAVIGVNLALCVVCYVLAYGGGHLEAVFLTSAGAWSALCYVIAVECLSGPEPTRRLFLIPVDIPKVYYPLAFLAFASFFAGQLFRADLALGVALGYVDHHGYLAATKPSATVANRLETSVPCLTRLAAEDPGFISARAALGAAAWVRLVHPDAGDWARRGRIASMLEAFRSQTSQGSLGGGPQSAAAASSDGGFPEAGGHVLGSGPAPGQSSAAEQQIPIAVPVPAPSAPPAPARTAAANRATILAAAEKRVAALA